MGITSQDVLNQATWSKPWAQRELTRNADFTDAGERAAFELVASKLHGEPILDLGVGMGRTIPLFRPLTGEYRALDCVPAMVAATRRSNPDVSIAVGDARSLTDYPDAHFGLVVFSFNGIDAVSHGDRRSILRAVRRVLAPGGLFFFSTLNLHGPSFRERPWRVRVWSPMSSLGYAWQVAQQVGRAPLDFVNWLKIRDGGERGSGFAVAPLSAHHYGVLAHYTTLERQLDELRDEGFQKPVVFDSARGAESRVADDTHDVDWFQLVTERN